MVTERLFLDRYLKCIRCFMLFLTHSRFVMHALEAIDAVDRVDGTRVPGVMRQIPPEAGKFLALLATVVPQGTYLEIGTSAGYSSLWIALACKELVASSSRLKSMKQK